MRIAKAYRCCPGQALDSGPPVPEHVEYGGQDHFSDGFTEELIVTLARCRWLLVAARNSSFSYKGRAMDARRVAEELGVRYILEGSVRRSETRIRTTAQLLKGSDGTLLWAERYDRVIADIFEIQDEIASEITGTIEPELSVIEFTALRDRLPIDMTAWETYLKGLWHLYRFTREELETAKVLSRRPTPGSPLSIFSSAGMALCRSGLATYVTRSSLPSAPLQ